MDIIVAEKVYKRFRLKQGLEVNNNSVMSSEIKVVFDGLDSLSRMRSSILWFQKCMPVFSRSRLCVWW